MSIREVISTMLMEGVSIIAFQDVMYTNGVEDNLFAQEVLNQLLLNEVLQNTNPPATWMLEDANYLFDALKLPIESINRDEASPPSGTVKETHELQNITEEVDEFEPWSQSTLDLAFPIANTQHTLIPIDEVQEATFDPWSTGFQSEVLEQEAHACLLDGEFKRGKTFYCTRCRIKFSGYKVYAEHRETYHAAALTEETIEAGPSGLREVVDTDPQVSDAQVCSGEDPYMIKLKGTRTFTRTSATYLVKFNHQWQVGRMGDIRRQLHRLFQELLARAQQDVRVFIKARRNIY